MVHQFSVYLYLGKSWKVLYMIESASNDDLCQNPLENLIMTILESHLEI